EGLPPGPLYGLITALAALENVIPPLPADTAVALGAFLAGRGKLNLWTVFGLTWVANVASASLVYWLARRYGRDFFKGPTGRRLRSEEHTSELQSRFDLVCRLLLEKKKKKQLAYVNTIQRMSYTYS